MTPYLTFDIELGAAIELGMTPLGQRRMVPLLGGTVSGAFSGTVLPGAGRTGRCSSPGARWRSMPAIS